MEEPRFKSDCRQNPNSFQETKLGAMLIGMGAGFQYLMFREIWERRETDQEVGAEAVASWTYDSAAAPISERNDLSSFGDSYMNQPKSSIRNGEPRPR